MSVPVKILCTCKNPKLLREAALIFETLRVGFPTAKVAVFLNGITDGECKDAIYKAASLDGVDIVDCAELSHGFWIEKLVKEESEPFFILDTDVRLFSSFERFDFSKCHLAGALSPEWDDEFTKCITRSRLHTSLLYIDPVKVRALICKYEAQFPKTAFNPSVNLFAPLQMPLRNRGHFYDTCALLYHAIGGTPFTPEQRDAYFHMQFGTCSDVVLPCFKDSELLMQARSAFLENKQLGMGGWRQQEAYFQSRQPVFDGRKVIPDGKINPELNRRICCGDIAAMDFVALWYRQCHGVDDLIDTLVDGRPMMCKDEMISLFFKEALIYNHPFYIKHQAMLYPICLQVTNAFKYSVRFENAPNPYLRNIAEVLKGCGNEMLSMIALICGGEEHMDKISVFMRGFEWFAEHDANGNPK